LADENPCQTFDFGVVDMQMIMERYPAQVSSQALALVATVPPPKDVFVPYLVKATQVDGKMAWASPIYVDK